MRDHLSIDELSNVEVILGAYLDAADNSILNTLRPVIGRNQPTYREILNLIYKELRTFGEGLDESWMAVKSLKFWNHKSKHEQFSIAELEEKIFEMYAAEYSDAEKKHRALLILAPEPIPFHFQAYPRYVPVIQL